MLQLKIIRLIRATRVKKRVVNINDVVKDADKR